MPPELLATPLPAPVPDAGLWLILALPLAGAILAAALVFAPRVRAVWAGRIAIAAMVGASLAALLACARLFALAPGKRFLVDRLFTLLAVERLHVEVSLALDPLAAVFVLVITVVGTLIHVYAAGYMRGDPGYARFFACLNLFVFAMLLLVLADSLLLCFAGWEGVGLASYLLIGFWHREPANGAAAQKAFIANRIGDCGFLAAMLLLVALFGGAFAKPGAWLSPTRAADLTERGAVIGPVAPTLTFRTLEAYVGAHDGYGQAALAGAVAETQLWGLPIALLVCLGLFLGMAGKSAQIPLYVWLPDAMAGPTPVSALIHAATMVTAGVYLAARMSFWFALAPAALQLLAVIGAATALVGALLAVVQHDLKKVLAYSTISQLGYMFLGLGAGAPGAAVFHVVTHACFKACLFLAAGSVIHAMADLIGHTPPTVTERRRRLLADPADAQDLRNMATRGLRAALPRTRLGYLAGAIALAGLPVASGFYSKDEILFRAFGSHGALGPWLYAVGLATAALTAFYVARSYYLAFPAEGARSDAHEPGGVMTTPVLVLAGAAIVIGPILGWPAAWGGGHPLLERFLALPGPAEAHGARVYVAQLFGAGVALGGWLAGRALFRQPARTAVLRDGFRQRFDLLHRALWNRLGADDLARALVVHPAEDFSLAAAAVDRGFVDGAVNLLARASRGVAALGGWLDRKVVDGVVNGVSDALVRAGRRLQRLQTGQLEQYTLGIALGAALLVVVAWAWVIR